MTRKHFIAIAKSLHASKPARDNQAAMDTWLHTITHLAETLRTFNPNFNSVRFLQACSATPATM